MMKRTAVLVGRRVDQAPAAFLQEGWVIANHILVSFHVAFISSILALPAAAIFKAEVLRFIFVSPETLVSAFFMYVSFHAGIALHELGHYLAAARLNALNDTSQQDASRVLEGSLLARGARIVQLFLLAPYGKASGIKREGLNYYPDAPYNLAVAAAGPRASRNVALVALLPAVLLLALGLAADVTWALYAGRLGLGIGIVGLLDFLLADPGKYAEFRKREQLARERADTVVATGGWWDAVAAAKARMLGGRIQELTHPRLGAVKAPWQFRNCGMGGRHTEKEYPESNVSMQEAMFLILGARDYQEAQEMTVRLQNRLKEIIEKAEGCRVMGIGLEGGLAPYIERGPYRVPEVRLWAMMKQTIEECGLRPGVDVAIALDPAMSELEIAYREEFKMPDSIGMYLFWRDRTLTVMDRDGVLDLYTEAMRDHDIPILSIEDGFSENDFEGWQNLLAALGDRVFVIGDDLVTTKDETIELAANRGLINTALIKANQIGTLYETILAMLVALGKNQQLVVSHRSKSPNDDMEAQIALAVNSLGLKCGGGANTERLVKYHAVTELMQEALEDPEAHDAGSASPAFVTRVFAYEEPTNAGLPSVGATVELTLPPDGLRLKFKGATPLGTSAGAGEAIHLVDAIIEGAEYRELIARHRSFFTELEPGVYEFDRVVRAQQIRTAGDDRLTELFDRAQRYDGKGCLNAVENVAAVIAPVFVGMPMADLSLRDIDRTLLALELHLARRRGKVAESASMATCIEVMQRKQNLGMNAVLSVSLALARGLAHLQGKDLYELLREETIAIIDQLASAQGIAVAGGRFSDYVEALRAVNDRLTEQGKPLYEALRETTGVYDHEAVAAVQQPQTISAVATGAPPQPQDESPTADTGDGGPAVSGLPAAAEALSERDLAEVAAVNQRLYEVYVDGADTVSRRQMLRRYVALKETILPHAHRFGIVNNRIFVDAGELIVPYLVGGTLTVFRVPAASSQPVFAEPCGLGRVLTDEYLKQVVGFAGDPIDLEEHLVAFDADEVGPVQVVRIRDIAEQIKAISQSTNRGEAVYILRFLVARLSQYSFRKFLGAKNIQSEVRRLLAELTKLLNTPFSRELPLLIRILVRNIAGGVTKPKLIDDLWNDSIDLAEVHVRGSDIVNEIRRSTHHAIGRGTQVLARAYLTYLETGETEDLARLGYPQPSPADVQACQEEKPREILVRLIENLENLFGSSEIVGRIGEWQENYAATLICCEFGQNLLEEADKVATDGIGEKNRWVYYHHLRIIKVRVGEFAALRDRDDAPDRQLQALLDLKPDESTFDAEAAAHDLQHCIGEFVDTVRGKYQEELFADLAACIASYESGAHLATFEQLFDLRRTLRVDLGGRGFPEQRLLLLELDCLLEEMGYLALRHVSTRYEEEGVDIRECLRIIRMCALNLSHDGLHSRQLRDLVDMLADENQTYRELGNILTQIQRNYHHILWRLIAPFEKMRARFDLDEDELRIGLANMQRFLHDLNSMVAFADAAQSYVDHKVSDKGVSITAAAESAAEREPSRAVIHLSHLDEIRDLVESDDPATSIRRHYGGKGSGLIYISYLGIPTRDGFVLPISSRRAVEQGPVWSLDVTDAHLVRLESDISARDTRRRTFGGGDDPLLLAIRGGSVFSMPGILSTVLFVGMTEGVVDTLAATDPWHAYDSFRRFLASFAQGVWGFDVEKHSIVESVKERHGVRYKQELPWEGMQEIAEATRALLIDEGYGEALEEALADPRRQLQAAIQAVEASWNSDTAQRYREIKGICDSWRTAVIVQEMSSGNRRNREVREGMDEAHASLTGVVPRTIVNEHGVRDCVGEFKFSAAGEDLVGGLSTSISLLPFSDLATYTPMLDRRIRHTMARLRRFMGTDQEIEFTVDQGELSVLQSRAAEIGANRCRFAFRDAGEYMAHGIGVRGSAFRGLVAFDERDYDELRGRDLTNDPDVDGIIMVLENPTPDDIPLLLCADGLLAGKGGSTSHAAVAINGIGDKDYHAIVGADSLRVDGAAHVAVVIGPDGSERARISTGQVVSIDGSSGAVYIGSRLIESL